MEFIVAGALLLLGVTAFLARSLKTASAGGASFRTDSGDLLLAIRKHGIVSRGITEPEILCGIAFGVRQGGLLLMAGDGHRASTQFLPMMDKQGKGWDFVLPQADVERLVPLLEASEGPVRIEKASRRLVKIEGASVLESEVIRGRFPNLVEIFPQSFAHDFRIDRKPWLEALEPLEKEKGKALVIEIADDRVRLGEQEIAIRSTKATMTLHLDASYVYDVIRENEDRRLRFHFDAPLKPVMFSDGEGWSCLIMPRSTS